MEVDGQHSTKEIDVARWNLTMSVMGITGLEKASESLQTVVALRASDIGNLEDGLASLTILP